MRTVLFFLPVFLFTISTSIIQADVIHVPDDAPTIQEGIDAAMDGDTVLIRDGVYTGYGNRDIDFLGKAITVRSESGNPYACIIDCKGTEISNHRGFLFITDEGPGSVLEGITITNGYMNPPEIGGGVLCEGSAPTFINCVFSNNRAYDGGGLANNSSSHVTVTGCVFTGNSGGAGGGMASSSGSFPTISYCTFYDNRATTYYGGGLSLVWSTARVTNCTFYGNFAPEGSGLHCGHGAQMVSENCIVAFNDGGEGLGVNYFGASPHVYYTDIYGNAGGDWVGEIAYLYGVDGNISEDPLFVLQENADFRLLWGSPGIDAGHPDSLDVDGTCRDMGAYCFDQNDFLTLYMTPDGTEVSPGGQLGVTYTVINRWEQSESFSGSTQAILPNGNPVDVMGPINYTVPANVTIRRHLRHAIPARAPQGLYEYLGEIGQGPLTEYDEDRFLFRVIE